MTRDTCGACGQYLARKPFPVEKSVMDATRANAQPNASHRALIRVVMDREASYLFRLNEEVLAQTNILERLQQEREIHAKSFAAYRSLLAPIKTLPNEILADIFLCVIQLAAKDARSIPMARLTLCSVSRSWRTVALTDPFIWQHVVMEGRVDDTILCLRRSQAIPLSFTIHDCVLDPSQISSVALASSWRWQNATFSTLTPLHFSALQHITGRLRSLKTLHLNGGLTGLDKTLLDAPLLTDVHISEFVPSKVLSLPWSQLKRLSLSHLAVPVFIRPLGACTQLEELDITDCSAPGDVLEATVGPPSVLRLTFTVNHGVSALNDPCDFFFTRATFPVLQDLRLHVHRFYLAPLLSFLAQSTRIKTLHLGSPGIALTDVQKILPFTPLLENLHLYDLCHDFAVEALVTNLTIQPSPHIPFVPLVPRLATLEFPGRGLLSSVMGLGLGGNLLIEMIKSRWSGAWRNPRSVSKLKSVTVHLAFPVIDPEALASLRRLKQAGFDMNVVGGAPTRKLL